MKRTVRTPGHLSSKSKSFYKRVVSEYDLENHHLKLLRLACESWDRGQQAREVIEKEGLTFIDKTGQPKPRPEVKIENDCRIGFARLLRELQLDATPAESRIYRKGVK